ncbi:unnamed protein product [Chrysoparadoxa australica]
MQQRFYSWRHVAARLSWQQGGAKTLASAMARVQERRLTRAWGVWRVMCESKRARVRAAKTRTAAAAVVKKACKRAVLLRAVLGWKVQACSGRKQLASARAFRGRQVQRMQSQALRAWRESFLVRKHREVVLWSLMRLTKIGALRLGWQCFQATRLRAQEREVQQMNVVLERRTRSLECVMAMKQRVELLWSCLGQWRRSVAVTKAQKLKMVTAADLKLAAARAMGWMNTRVQQSSVAESFQKWKATSSEWNRKRAAIIKFTSRRQRLGTVDKQQAWQRWRAACLVLAAHEEKRLSIAALQKYHGTLGALAAAKVRRAVKRSHRMRSDHLRLKVLLAWKASAAVSSIRRRKLLKANAASVSKTARVCFGAWKTQLRIAKQQQALRKMALSHAASKQRGVVAAAWSLWRCWSASCRLRAFRLKGVLALQEKVELRQALQCSGWLTWKQAVCCLQLEDVQMAATLVASTLSLVSDVTELFAATQALVHQLIPGTSGILFLAGDGDLWTQVYVDAVEPVIQRFPVQGVTGHCFATGSILSRPPLCPIDLLTASVTSASLGSSPACSPRRSCTQTGAGRERNFFSSTDSSSFDPSWNPLSPQTHATASVSPLRRQLATQPPLKNKGTKGSTLQHDSLLCIPVGLQSGKLLGVLKVLRAPPLQAAFSVGEVASLCVCAAALGGSIHRVQIAEQVQSQVKERESQSAHMDALKMTRMEEELRRVYGLEQTAVKAAAKAQKRLEAAKEELSNQAIKLKQLGADLERKEQELHQDPAEQKLAEELAAVSHSRDEFKAAYLQSCEQLQTLASGLRHARSELDQYQHLRELLLAMGKPVLQA